MTTKKRQFPKGIKLRPDTDALIEEGEVKYDDTAKKVQYQDDSATRSVVSEDGVQTLENKTMDFTSATGNNTISADASDIDYDNAGSTLVAADVKAALDEVDARLLAQDEADEITYDNTTSGLAAVQVQAAIDEVEARVDTIEAETYVNSFNTRVGDVVSAASDYDAVQVDYDNTTSGLAAVEVQAAIDEVEGRLGTVEGTGFVNSFNTRTGAVTPAASDYDADQVDYDNATSGLAAVEVQAALDEIDGDLDTHISDTTAHGTTGNVVGTSDSQTLTNKTINSSDIDLGTASNTNKLVLSKDTTANLEALTRESGSMYYSTDEESYFGDDGADLISLGGGAGGGLDSFVNENFDRTRASDLVSGNSAIFAASGILDGSLADNELTQIANKRSIKYTMGASSTNDWFHLESITIDPKQQDQSCKAAFYSSYNGLSDEVSFVVWDVTNSLNLADLAINDDNLRRYELGFTPRSNTTEIKVGFQVGTGNSGKILEFDDIEVKVLGQGEFVVNETGTSEVKAIGANGFGSAGTKIRRFDSEDYTLGDDVTYADDATSGATFVANSSGVYYINYNDTTIAGNVIGMSKNASDLTLSIQSVVHDEQLVSTESGSTGPSHCNWVGYLESGDIIRAHTDGSPGTNDAEVYFVMGKIKPLGSDRRIMRLKHEVGSGVAGGTATSGSWGTRTLNSAEGSQSFFVSLNSSQFTLKPGKYRLLGLAEFYSCDDAKIRIRNITDSVDVVQGTGGHASSVNNGSYTSSVVAEVEIFAEKTFEFQYQVQTTQLTNGLGKAPGFGTDEIHGQIEIEDIATGGNERGTIVSSNEGGDTLISTNLLSTDMNSNAVMTDLTYGITSGKSYRVGGQFVLQNNTNDASTILIQENGNTVGTIFDDTSTANNSVVTYGVNCVFTATADGSLTFTQGGSDGNATLRGNSTRSESYVTLEELGVIIDDGGGTKIVETKIMASNKTTNGVIGDFTRVLENAVVYRISGQVQIRNNSTNATDLQIILKENGNIVGQIQQKHQNTGNANRTVALSHIFTSTGTGNFTMEVVGMDLVDDQISANGTRDQFGSYIVVEKVLPPSGGLDGGNTVIASKFLSADVTTNTTISDLTTSISSSKKYRISGQFDLFDDNNDDFAVVVKENGNIIAQLEMGPSTTGTQICRYTYGVNIRFNSTGAGNLTFETTGIASDGEVKGDGTASSTFIKVEEVESFGAPVNIEIVNGQNQTKLLTSTITTDVTMTDITFNNLELGVFYRVHGQVHTLDSANDAFRVEIKENGNIIGRVFQDPSASGTISNIYGVNHMFESTGTGSLTFTTVGVGATGQVVGDGTRSNTYITLEEIKYMETTTKWT